MNLWLWAAAATYGTGGLVTWRHVGYNIARGFANGYDRGSPPDMAQATGGAVLGLLVGIVWPLMGVVKIIQKEPFLSKVHRDGKELKRG